MEIVEKAPERSLGDLFGALTEDLKSLVQQEARLAKVEVGSKLMLAAQNLGLLALGTGVFYAGFLVGLLGVVTYLASTGVALWQAGALVAIVALCVGGGLALAGLSDLRSMSMRPEQTITTLKEDAKWLKDQVGKSQTN